jgi:porphobilinogen deaminase
VCGIKVFRDCMTHISFSLLDLPDGSVVGTSSVRRSAQLKRKFPGLVFQDVVRLKGIQHTPTFTMFYFSKIAR